MLKAGVREWYSPCQQGDYRITTWAVSEREAAQHVAVKDNIRLMLNWTKPPRAPVAGVWCTCPWGVTAPVTFLSQRLLLQIKSCWGLESSWGLHEKVWLQCSGCTRHTGLVLALQQVQFSLFAFLFPTPCSAAFAFTGKSCFLSVKKWAKVYSVKWFFSPLSPFRGDWQDLQVSHYMSSCFQRLQTPRLLKINELDTVKAQEFLASSRIAQYIMVFKRKKPTQVYTNLPRITASLHFGGLKFWRTWQCVCLH